MPTQEQSTKKENTIQILFKITIHRNKNNYHKTERL